MAEPYTCPPQAGGLVTELPGSTADAPKSSTSACPTCRQVGKHVQGQTVKALLVVSLRSLAEAGYLFCRTQTCPVVYFTADSGQTYTTTDIREHIYQKEPERHDVFVCYCFRHTVGEIRAASPVAVASLVADIVDGIRSGQWRLRSPQSAGILLSGKRPRSHKSAW